MQSKLVWIAAVFPAVLWAQPQLPSGSQPEWLTMRDTTEVEAIYSALRRSGSPDSHNFTSVEGLHVLDEESLGVFQAFGAEVYQADLAYELETAEAFCDERAPTNRQDLIARWQEVMEAEKERKQNAVDELFGKLSQEAVAALKAAYNPGNRTWSSQTSEIDYAILFQEADPSAMRDRACNVLAVALEGE